MIINITSHSKMLLSFTRPQDIPGMSLSDCICFSCRLSRAPAAEPEPEELDMSLMIVVEVDQVAGFV